MQVKLHLHIINISLCFCQLKRVHDCFKVLLNQKESCHFINIMEFLFYTLVIVHQQRILSLLEE
uniref:Uncharacterized protein n=1 Tax=Rhizophora mucronata TaxID=61149 RepID=A0A2P2ILN0_RHIMU